MGIFSFLFVIQVYHAKKDSMFHVTLDVVIVLCYYSQSAITALSLAAALVA